MKLYEMFDQIKQTPTKLTFNYMRRHRPELIGVCLELGDYGTGLLAGLDMAFQMVARHGAPDDLEDVIGAAHEERTE